MSNLEPHDCAHTQQAAAAFLAGSLSAAEVSRLRAHRAECRDCDETWRQSLAAAGSMQHAPRTRRVEDEKVARRAANRRMAMAALNPSGPSRKRRRAHMRLILLPALAVVVMMVIHPMSKDRRASLAALAGEVRLAASTLAPDGAPVPLVRGDLCATGELGRARIEWPGAVVELGGETSLLVEDEFEGRLRLDGGELVVEGDCTVTSRFGVVDVRAGRAGMQILPEGLELEALSGRILATNSQGEHTVQPGSRAVLGHPRR